MLGADPFFGEKSREALRDPYDSCVLAASEVVWAEVRAHFPSDESFATAVDLLGVRFEPLSRQAAATAGQLWREYRRRAKEHRTRVVADFIVGAHALLQADALLS